MKVFYSIDEALDHLVGGALSIGNFDGVHLGHQALLKKTCELKGQGLAGVLTFSPHPKEILCPKEKHFYLTTNSQKIEMFMALGLDVAIFQDVDEKFLKLSAPEFVEKLALKLKIKHIVVGEDFTFGQKALGETKLLSHLGQVLGFLTHVMSKVAINGITCSSSAIREFLKDGDLESAKDLLGRDFSVRGTVVEGKKLGRLLGFPTANLKVSGFLLSLGVYVSRTTWNRMSEPSITNLGVRPTMGDSQELVVETHVLNGDHMLYGQEIEVHFIHKLRDEKKFSSVTALQEQVKIDCAEALKIHTSARFLLK